MTFPHNSPRPGPPPGGFRPGPQPNGPQPSGVQAGGPRPGFPNAGVMPAPGGGSAPSAYAEGPIDGSSVHETGHPTVDAVLRSLENAARLAPTEQIAEFEAAHQVLQETLASIDG